MSRALALLVVLASALAIAGCSAIVASPPAEVICDVGPGQSDPCPEGSLCVGAEVDGYRRGTCQVGCVPEVCDGLDNDCDSVTDDDPSFDADGDTYTWCGSGDPSRIDCNDANALVHPFDELTAQPQEVCDGIDNDCNGIVDDPSRACPAGEFCSTMRRCYEPGDCTVPEATCTAPGTFCDATTSPPGCRDIPEMGCIPNPETCTASERCDIVTNTCLPLLGLGETCVADMDCASGACFDQPALSYDGTGSGSICSAPCCSDADCMRFGQARCLVTARGGRGCMPEATIGTTERACSRDADCGAQICRAYGNVPTGTEPRLRSVCADGAVVHGDDCSFLSGTWADAYCGGYCLGDECAIRCSTAGECYSGLCAGGVCRSTCRTSADCPSEMRCGFVRDAAGNFVQACVFRADAGPPGTACSEPTMCVDGYCASDGRCAGVCCTDADCGGAVCRPVLNGAWEMRCVPRVAGG